jgi:DNA-binding LacI/PurR family transcriptional regulator
MEARAELYCEGDYSPASGYDRMRSLLASKAEFNALMCGNDQMAIGAIRALLDAGRRIPEEVAVMGFDNNFPGTLITPSLSTVAVPKQSMGREAVELLLWRIQSGFDAPAKIVSLDTSLVIRASTDAGRETKWDLNDW